MAKKRDDEPMTMAEALTGRGRGAALHRRIAAERETAASPPPPPAPTMPSLPPIAKLSVDDLARCTAAIGLAMPPVESMHVAPPDPKLSKSLADTFLERVAKYRAHEREQRAADIESTRGRFDASTASPEHVRSRLADLGLGDDANAVAFVERGAPLEREHVQDRASMQREVDLRVVERVQVAIKRGERFNARALTASQVQLLVERGVSVVG